MITPAIKKAGLIVSKNKVIEFQQLIAYFQSNLDNQSPFFGAEKQSASPLLTDKLLADQYLLGVGDRANISRAWAGVAT